MLGPNGSTLLASGSVADGNGGRDYTISFVSAKGTITPAALMVTAVGDSRVYDGTTSSSGTPTFGPLFGTDSASFTQAFQSKDVLGPNGSTLLASGSVADGNGGQDYTISFVSANGTITPAALTVTAVGDSRVYNGTTSSSGSPTFGPLFGTDSASFTQAFQSKDVLGPNGSTLLASGSVADGNGGRDYTISFVSAKGTITPAALTVTAVGDSRVYNGTTSSSGTPTFGPLFGTDSASFTQAFQSKDVLGPNGSTLLASGSVADGNGGQDYTISFVSAKGTITPAALTVTAVGDRRAITARLHPRAPDLRPAVRHRQRELHAGLPVEGCARPKRQHAVGLGQCRRRQRGPGLHHQLRLGQGHHHAGFADGDGGLGQPGLQRHDFILGQPDLRPAVRHRQRELHAGLPVEGCARPERQHAVGLGQCRRRQRGPGLHHPALRLGQGHHHAGFADGDGGRGQPGL